jgi:hypothetical protein
MMPKKNRTDNSFLRAKKHHENSVDFTPFKTLQKRRPPSAELSKTTPKNQNHSGYILQNNRITPRGKTRPQSGIQSGYYF